MTHQKIAFIHDRLYYIAWAEQVFFQMIEDVICSDVPAGRPIHQIEPKKKQHYRIFTMFSDKKFLIIRNTKIPIITALPRWIFAIFVYFDKHKIPYISKLLDYRNLMFFYPLLIRILQRKIKQYHPTEAHISSFAVAKNIATTQQHSIVYNLHAQSPFMYIHNHYENNLKKLKFPIKQFYAFAHRFLSPRDLATRHYQHISANSGYTAWLIQHIYGLPIHDIHYPKLDPLFSQFPVSAIRSDYFVFIGRLVTFSKQVDIIIQAFNESKYKLVIIGSGPDEQYLQSIAWPNIEFLGRIADPLERCRIIWNACWLVNITMESFGYVTAESVCLGTPVIGYIKWATPEIVDTESGLLIAHQDKKDLKQSIIEFLQKDRNYSEISIRARAKFTFSNLKFELK